MSWIDKEIRRRDKARTAAAPSQPSPEQAATRMAALWAELESANDALPPDLRLAADRNPAPAIEGPGFRVWLRAPNGAALGFTGEAIRYLWPDANPRRSNNFWIHWSPERGRYVTIQRVGPAAQARAAESRFEVPRAAYVIKCLVTGIRLKPGAVRKRRLGLF